MWCTTTVITVDYRAAAGKRYRDTASCTVDVTALFSIFNECLIKFRAVVAAVYFCANVYKLLLRFFAPAPHPSRCNPIKRTSLSVVL